MRIVHDGIVAEFGDLVARPEPWRVCVTGGREFDNIPFTAEALALFERTIGPIGLLAHGDARGLDRTAARLSKLALKDTRAFPADWDRYGDAAGAIRNGEMLEEFQPEVLLVFPGGTGTADCTRKARKMGIPRVFFTEPEEAPFADLLKWG